MCCCFFFFFPLVNIDSLCVIRNVCQTQIVLFLPAQINLFNAESNHPLRLRPCRWLSACCCVGPFETKTTCAVRGASVSGHLICHSADSAALAESLSRPHPLFSISLSLPFPFLLHPPTPTHTRCIQRFTSGPGLLTHIP